MIGSFCIMVQYKIQMYQLPVWCLVPIKYTWPGEWMANEYESMHKRELTTQPHLIVCSSSNISLPTPSATVRPMLSDQHRHCCPWSAATGSSLPLNYRQRIVDVSCFFGIHSDLFSPYTSLASLLTINHKLAIFQNSDTYLPLGLIGCFQFMKSPGYEIILKLS